MIVIVSDVLSRMSCIFLFQISEDDKLPRVICLRCTEQLELFYKFKEAARKTEDILQQFLAFTKKNVGTNEVGGGFRTTVKMSKPHRLLYKAKPEQGSC